jgi:D-sedoheptulose 7-phosphate isomerase
MINKRIKESIEQSIATKQHILQDVSFQQRIQEAADMIVACLKADGKVHFCGNGGSAADAQHLAAELSGRFYFDRPPLNAEALHCNTSYLTAVGNDYGYDKVFSRLLQGTGHKGDVLIGLSTSGNSRNILEAYRVAREKGMHIISLTGSTGGMMKEDSEILFNVPSTDTPRIQESHIMIGHIICELVESSLFGNK